MSGVELGCTVIAAAIGSAVLTWLALRYARWRRLLDLPGQRRSHVVPTPRGGGIGMVIVALLALLWLPWQNTLVAICLGTGVLFVAGIGSWDDHRPLSAKVRLLIHLLAALLLVLALLITQWPSIPVWAVLLLAILSLFWLAGCINAWNFMDGSNGLLTLQGIWLGGAVAVILEASPDISPDLYLWALWAVVLAAAGLGFLPFNFPRARIFMGDVGSGALGLMGGGLLLLSVWLAPQQFWLLLLLPSVLLVDAGMTLLWRVLQGRRWYNAHREHLYQWLIRCGWSHTQVAVCYLGWNLLVIAPVGFVMHRHPSWAPALAVCTLLLMAGGWWVAKQRLLQRRRSVFRQQGHPR